ncbi:hypothetical protein H9Q70_011411 [Fusarium xylarioides]|nr:hypothetical protein H9Q70_011411 [Fusarium xylarioides]
MPLPAKRRHRETDGSDEYEQSSSDGSIINSRPLEDDTTPKAPRQYDKQAPRQYGKLFQDSDQDGHSTSEASSSRSRRSSRSKASSPSKKQRNAALEEETGHDIYSFAQFREWQPEPLKNLKHDLHLIQRGNRIIPIDLKDKVKLIETLDQRILTRRKIATLDEYAYYDKNNASVLSAAVQYQYPDQGFVDDMVQRAALCLSENEAEASWNMDVHGPLLTWVFRKEKRVSRFTDYRYCPSTHIVTDFKPRASSNLVDFCIHIRPAEESPAQLSIKEICKSRPLGTINHVDGGNLNKDPIVISIETKKHGEEYGKAVTQMATWHSAQLRSLRYTSDDGRLPPRTLTQIQFLPGIIVQGHVWSFVATVERGGRAVLFHQAPIGNTNSQEGVLKLLLSLQHLKYWAEEVYWPAFQADIIGSTEMPAVNLEDNGKSA